MSELAKKALTLVATLSLALFASAGANAEVPQKTLDAAKAALEDWDLDYADHPGPQVDAGDNFKGYRVIFTKRYDEDVEKEVAGRSKPRYNHVDLVLVPDGQGKGFDPLDAKSSIRWSAMPEEYYAVPTWLGEGYGFNWFCKASVQAGDALRAKLKLSGGESRVETLSAALAAEDRDFKTAKYAADQLKPFGKEAIGGIVKTVSAMSAAGKIPRAPLYALKNLGTPESDNAVVAYLGSKDQNVCIAAGDAICLKPYLKKAKPHYLKLLQERRNIPQAGEAAMQLDLGDEAIAALTKTADAPADLNEFRDAVIARSGVKSGKIDNAPFTAADDISILLLHSGEIAGTPRTLFLGETSELSKIKLSETDMKRVKPKEDLLVAGKDKELAFVAALWLSLFNAPEAKPEYSARVRESGMRVLKALPRENVEPQLAKLAKNVERKNEAEALQKLYRRYLTISGGAPDPFASDLKPAKQTRQKQ